MSGTSPVYHPMLENLTARLARIVKQVRGEARLTEANIQEALREVRIALLEADVALPVVKHFIDAVRAKALGAEVVGSLTPGQKKKVALVSTDVYRPAAIEQLKTVAAQVGAEFIGSEKSEKPVDIARHALDYARTHYMDVLIVDTAGRLAIDEEMMREIAELHAALQPVETLFVVDAMQGQDAANVAKGFGDALPLTGVVLTKLDGDARGGAALSVRRTTGKPIKFAGVGEKLANLEPFHPERMASRILGMGDVLSLVEEARRSVDLEEAEKLAEKVTKGRGF